MSDNQHPKFSTANQYTPSSVVEGGSELVKVQTIETKLHTQLTMIEAASYELSKSRGDRARGLELLDQLDAHFQSTP